MPPKDTATLKECLERLAFVSIEKNQQCFVSGQYKTTTANYRSFHLKDIPIGPSRNSFSCDIETHERTGWDARDHYRFVEREIESLPEFNECVTMIMYVTGIDILQAKSDLQRFTSYVTSRSDQIDISPLSKEAASIMVSNLLGEPTDWGCESWFSGVWFEEDAEYNFGKFATLRRPRPSDLRNEIPNDFFQGNPIDRWARTTAILEFSMKAKSAIEVQHVEGVSWR